MSIRILRNKAAKEITREDFEVALTELKDKNSTINILGYEEIDGVLHINFEVTVETGGFVTEQLRFGQFVSLVETGVSSAEREKMIAESDAKRKSGRELKRKRSDAAIKAAKTRDAKKPESNITHHGRPATFDEMISVLIELHPLKTLEDRSNYNNRFVDSIAGKSRLTSKQHNYLCKVAKKHGYVMAEKTVRAQKAAKPQASQCRHEDLGSLGYNHGETVKCPFCGKMARVW